MTTNTKVAFTLRVDPILRAAIKADAALRRMTMQELIEEVLSNYIQRKPLTKEQREE